MAQNEKKHLRFAALGTGVAAVIALITIGVLSFVSAIILALCALTLIGADLKTSSRAFLIATLGMGTFATVVMLAGLMESQLFFWPALLCILGSFFSFLETLRRESQPRVAGHFRVSQGAFVGALITGPGLSLASTFAGSWSNALEAGAMVLGAAGLLVSDIFLIRAGFALYDQCKEPPKQPKELGL